MVIGIGAIVLIAIVIVYVMMDRDR